MDGNPRLQERPIVDLVGKAGKAFTSVRFCVVSALWGAGFARFGYDAVLVLRGSVWCGSVRFYSVC